MKLIIALLLLAPFAMANTFNIDTKASKVTWLGKKVSGKHNGSIGIKSGTVKVEKGMVKSGEFVIDMNAIIVDDIKNPEWNKKLVDHLRSNDFFDSANHKEGKFVIKSVKKKGKMMEIAGDMTLRGKTNPESIQADIKIDGKKATAKGKMEIDRTKYGLKYSSGKFFDPKKLGDKMIYDKFEIGVEFTAMMADKPKKK